MPLTAARKKELRASNSVWRLKDDRRKKLWRRRKAVADPSYLIRERERLNAWRAKKLAECPEYAKLKPLRDRIDHLRERIGDMQEQLATKDQLLCRLVSEFDALKRKLGCKGRRGWERTWTTKRALSSPSVPSIKTS